MDENKFLAVLEGLLFPPRCCACGTFLREHMLDTEPRALCESCRRKWEYAKLTVCQKCGEELSKCRCIPPVLRRAGGAVSLKMVSYNKMRDTTVRRCVLYMKRKNTRAVFDFFAGQLSELLGSYLAQTYTSPKDVLVTYLPRSRKNALKDGLDQSELLAKGVSRILGCDMGKLVYRVKRRTREQKHLDKAARQANMEGAFALCEADFSAINKTYRCIAVVDDVITTGASLASCVRELKKVFGGRIVCVCLAETEKN